MHDIPPEMLIFEVDLVRGNLCGLFTVNVMTLLIASVHVCVFLGVCFCCCWGEGSVTDCTCEYESYGYEKGYKI